MNDTGFWRQPLLTVRLTDDLPALFLQVRSSNHIDNVLNGMRYPTPLVFSVNDQFICFDYSDRPAQIYHAES
jgi:hypothetical protein